MKISSGKLASDSHREWEERYRLLLNATAEAIYGLDRKGRCIFCNPAGARMMGFDDATKVVGRNIRHFAPPLKFERTSATNEVQRNLASRTPLAQPRPPVRGGMVRRADGTSFWAEYWSHPIRKNGRIAGRVVTLIDVSDRKRTEEALRESEELLQLALESSHIGSWSWDLNENALVWDHFIHPIFGLEPGTFGGRFEDFLALVHDDDRDRVRQQVGACVKHGEPFNSEYKVVWPDASVHWLASRGMVHRDRPGVPRMVGVCWEVTERRRAEDVLRRQSELFEQSFDAVIVWHWGGEIIFWNAGAEHLYGISKAEAIGQSSHELLQTGHADGLSSLLAKLQEESQCEAEIVHTTRDGRAILVETRMKLIRDPAGDYVIETNRDVTDRKNLEMQLLRAQRLESIGTLASGMAHDLNNVLAPILLCAEMLRRKNPNRDPASLLALIEECARRGSGIVRQVLTFARGIEGERVVIKPSHLVQEVGEIAKETFPKAITVTATIAEELWSIRADPTQLHQVLLNLAVNARDSMPAGGSLDIEVQNREVSTAHAARIPGGKSGAFVVFRVRDTGSGMSPEVADKIFDPFFTTKAPGKGTGLGLSTALGIVKSHGGFISLQSQPGEGTVFDVYLPAEARGVSALATAADVGEGTASAVG